MTKEQYKSELGVLDSKIRQSNARKIEIRKKFIRDNSKFKVGDKVVVIYDAYKHPYDKDRIMPEVRKEAYISSVHDKYFSGNVSYDFVKVKKDGSMSAQPASIYGSYSRIELLTPAETQPQP